MGGKCIWVVAWVGIGLAGIGAAASAGEGSARVVVADDAAGTGHAWLGVGIEEETERPEGGARVLHVVPGSPADSIGLTQGDVIVSVDGETVYGPRGLTRRLRSHAPGDAVEIEIVRDGQPQALTVDLGERPDKQHFFEDLDFDFHGEELEEQLRDMERGLRRFRVDVPGGWAGLHGLGQRPRLGVRLVEVTPELREHLGGERDAGVLVGQVMKGMPAEMAGIRVGDLIEAVDGRAIEDAGDLIDAIRNVEDGVLRIDLVRDGRPQSVDVVLPDPSETESRGGPRA